MKTKSFSKAVRKTEDRERLTSIPDRNLVRALGASGYSISAGFVGTEPDPCPHEDYSAPT